MVSCTSTVSTYQKPQKMHEIDHVHENSIQEMAEDVEHLAVECTPWHLGVDYDEHPRSIRCRKNNEGREYIRKRMS